MRAPTSSPCLDHRITEPIPSLGTRCKEWGIPLLAFLGRHSKECGGFLPDVLASTLRTFDLALFVLGKGQDQFEGLLAILTIKLISGHGDLRKPGKDRILSQDYAQETVASR